MYSAAVPSGRSRYPSEPIASANPIGNPRTDSDNVAGTVTVGNDERGYEAAAGVPRRAFQSDGLTPDVRSLTRTSPRARLWRRQLADPQHLTRGPLL